MTFTFNLIEQPWLPCAMLPDGRPAELALGEIFAHAGEVREISDSSPLVTISIHRLLVAILHRTHGPATTDDWERIWRAGIFDAERVSAYFDEWRDCFDLFDPERPFYQTVEVELDYTRSIAQMVYGLTLGNYVTLFDHSRQDQPPGLTPADAARQVLAIQNFAVGGLTPYRSKHGEPASPYKYAQNSPLTKGAVVLARGQNLFETLMLNLHRYAGGAGAPFEFDPAEDLPAWERDAPARAEDRLPDGYIDLLTWQSRRVRLAPEEAPDGGTVVRAALVMKGCQFPPGDFHLRDYETMLTFSFNPRASKNQDPWPMLSLRPDRAVWRDSTALFRTTGTEDALEHQRPRILDWIAELRNDEVIPRGTRVLVDVHGMATDRASVDLWRHEQLPLPVDLLGDRDRLYQLRRALELADDVSGLFSSRVQEIPVSGSDKPCKMPSPLQVFAENLLTMSETMQPDRDAVRRLVDSLAPGDSYWSRLETPYKHFLTTLPELDLLDARRQWAGHVREAAREAWRPIFRSFDSSARGLKAAVRADGAFDYQLRALLDQYAPQREEIADGEAHPASTAVR